MTVDVAGLIRDAGSNATNLVIAARGEIGGSASALVGLAANPGITGTFAYSAPSMPAPFTPATPPQLVESVLDLSGKPGSAPSLTPLPGAKEGIGTMPTFKGKAPILDFPVRPSELRDFSLPAPELDLTGNFPAAPVIADGVMPDAPSITLPAQPGAGRAFTESLPVIKTEFDFPEPPELLTAIGAMPELAWPDMPDRPQIDVPQFNVLAPVLNGQAPTGLDAKFMSAYREAAPSFFAALDGQMDAGLKRLNPAYHDQLALMEGKLQSFIADGGTALKPEIEDAIYARTTGKVHAEFKRVRSTAYADAARRGFTLPDGVAFSAVRQARQDGADNNTRAAVEIAIKMAELEQQNIQFAITTSGQLRNTAMQAAISYHQNLISINGQALDAAKSVLAMMIEGYNTEVKLYEARLGGYRADAAVFEAHMRGVSTHIEIFKAEIAGFEAEVQVDTAKVNAYRAKVDAAQAIGALYKSQVEAIVSQAGLEKLKIESFGARVEAYRSEVQAKVAEWQGFSAAVNGEEAKAQIYAQQVQGFKAGVEAGAVKVTSYRTMVDAEISKLALQKLKIEGFAAQVQAFGAEAQAKAGAWQGYTAGVSGEAAKMQAFAVEGQAFGHEVDAYKAGLEANVAAINGAAAGNRGKLDAYTAENQAYGAKMQAEGARASAAMTFQQHLISAYSAANQAAIAVAEQNASLYRVQSQVALEIGKVTYTGMVEAAKVKVAAAEGVARTAIGAAGIYGSMAGAALSGMNSLVVAEAT